MLFSRLIVLLLIRKGLLRVLIQTRRLVRLLEMAHNNAGGDTLRRDKEYLRYGDTPPVLVHQCITLDRLQQTSETLNPVYSAHDSPILTAVHN